MSIGLDNLRLLHVEPSDTQRKLIAAEFAKIGVNAVTWVQTGQQAKDILADTEFNLIVSAMHLADTTGSELINNIRNGTKQSNIPFMLISSETSSRYLEPVRQAGVVAMLPKPFATEQLEKSIHATLDFIEPDELEIVNAYLEEFSVLVVDDSETSLRHIVRLLKKMGVEKIFEARDGREALSHMRVESIDLVVTDYHMPTMDGKELIQRIRREEEQTEVPILILSSEHDQAKLDELRAIGASEICDKPFATNVIKQLIEKIVNT
ncbi:MAG: response regulator [Thiohalomonadales bacterium]